MPPIFLDQILEASRKKKSNKRRIQTVRDGNLISARDFLHDWPVEYRCNDRPGCYAIYIFDQYAENPDIDEYEMSYGGQSTAVFDRVHNHLTGKGNGDVYADMRSGKQLFIRIIPCMLHELNDTERQIIGSLDPKRCYNKNRGGATIRTECGEPQRCNVFLKRAESKFNSALSLTVLCDGRQVAKLSNGESTSFVASEGPHTLTLKISGLRPVESDFIVQNGWGVLVEASLFTAHMKVLPIEQLISVKK